MFVMGASLLAGDEPEIVRQVYYSQAEAKKNRLEGRKIPTQGI